MSKYARKRPRLDDDDQGPRQGQQQPQKKHQPKLQQHRPQQTGSEDGEDDEQWDEPMLWPGEEEAEGKEEAEADVSGAGTAMQAAAQAASRCVPLLPSMVGLGMRCRWPHVGVDEGDGLINGYFSVLSNILIISTTLQWSGREWPSSSKQLRAVRCMSAYRPVLIAGIARPRHSPRG